MEKPLLIEKEELVNVSFKPGDVLTDEEQRKKRRSDIEQAMRFGNNEKGKIALIFDTTDGTKKVETTVWSVTENNVLLKKGITVPIRAIREILLYPAG